MASNTWAVVFIAVGAAMLLIGVAGGNLTYASAPEQFPAWMVVAFIGIILALIGVAMGMGKSGNKE
jgi:hypothetical protein